MSTDTEADVEDTFEDDPEAVLEELPTEAFTAVRKRPVEMEARRVAETTAIPTPDGVLVAYQGDVVIRDAAGERWPCDPELFAEVYELIEEGSG